MKAIKPKEQIAKKQILGFILVSGGLSVFQVIYIIFGRYTELFFEAFGKIGGRAETDKLVDFIDPEFLFY